MKRLLWALAHVGGGLVLLGFTWAAIVYTVPRAEAAEPCAGTTGMASYYGTESGSRTANGEHFNGTSMTAASRTLAFGTRLRVTFEGHSVVVRVNDRGPYVAGRILDLSRAAAVQLGMIDAGVARVCLERL